MGKKTDIDDAGFDDDDGRITLKRFAELVVIAVCSSVVILELIWTINDYRAAG